MRSANVMWLAPFISFIAGYLLIQYHFGSSTVEVPSLVGKQLHEAVCILSEKTLTARIVAHKEDYDVAQGTVLQQKPEPPMRIRSHQPIMLTLSKSPQSRTVPSVIGQRVDDVLAPITAQGLRVQVYDLQADVPQGICLAQWPSANQNIEHNETMIIYRAVAASQSYAMPSLYGKTVADVHDLCEKHSITCHVMHSRPVTLGHTCEQCIVIDQRPLPGTFVALSTNNKKPFIIQLQVDSTRITRQYERN